MLGVKGILSLNRTTGRGHNCKARILKRHRLGIITQTLSTTSTSTRTLSRQQVVNASGTLNGDDNIDTLRDVSTGSLQHLHNPVRLTQQHLSSIITVSSLRHISHKLATRSAIRQTITRGRISDIISNLNHGRQADTVIGNSMFGTHQGHVRTNANKVLANVTNVNGTSKHIMIGQISNRTTRLNATLNEARRRGITSLITAVRHTSKPTRRQATHRIGRLLTTKVSGTLTTTTNGSRNTCKHRCTFPYLMPFVQCERSTEVTKLLAPGSPEHSKSSLVSSVDSYDRPCSSAVFSTAPSHAASAHRDIHEPDNIVARSSSGSS